MNDHPSHTTQAATLWTRARWHRAQSRDFLNNSAHAMHQHERSAEALEAQAAHITREDVTK